MPFIRNDGTILPVFQQLTELVDEQLIIGASVGYEDLSGNDGITVSQGLIDASLKWLLRTLDDSKPCGLLCKWRSSNMGRRNHGLCVQ